jgi:hypothetical protein
MPAASLPDQRQARGGDGADAGNGLGLAVADPAGQHRQHQSGLNRAADAVVSRAAITQTQLSPTIKMTVAVKARWALRTRRASNNTLTLYPSADVTRDGSYRRQLRHRRHPDGEEDATSYAAARACWKFDLSSVSGTISSASCG